MMLGKHAGRRKFLRRLIQFTIPFAFSGQSSAAFSAIFTSNFKLRALPYFLDTLIPEDISPSASQLRLHEKLITHAKGIENYSKLLNLGCQWLDQQANLLYGKQFTTLDQEQMFNVVLKAEKSPQSSIPQLFFERIKNDTFVFYYAHPASWKSLGLDAPPQPSGYLDYTAAPKVAL